MKQMHVSSRTTFCRIIVARQPTIPASRAWLAVFTFDPCGSAALAGVRNPRRARGGCDPPSLLGGVIVVFVIRRVPLQQVLAREGLATNVADEPFAKGVRLDVTGEVLWAGVALLAVGTLVETWSAG